MRRPSGGLLFLGFVFTLQGVYLVHLWIRNGFNPYWQFATQVTPGGPGISQQAKGSDFSWKDAPSSSKLDWKPCYENRECTRLSVPLNYDEPEGRKASLALVRKKAEVPETSSFYRGPVLINPGGPGGSGVDTVRGVSGELVSKILGPGFDIVGFDPRGIARSTPRASFFREDVQRALFNQAKSERYIDSHEDVALAWSRAKVLGKLADETDDDYLAYINSDHTARDMLSIVEAHGREKLQYWGFSYGSVLGATFASMFPDRVERLVIDGVADSENYYATLWNNNLRDTDKVLDAFFTGCAQAGPEICPFWTADPQDIRQNLTNLYKSVAESPIPVVEDDFFGVLDETYLRDAIFFSLYKPAINFPILGKALADPAKYGRTLLELGRAPVGSTSAVCSCGSDDHLFDSVGDALHAVSCNDGFRVPGDLESTIKFYDDLVEKSEWGHIWARIHIACSGWPKRQNKHFQGPFIANTSHPLLLIGNTADPVTPLWAAKKMSRGFEGSVVLTQNSAGHCSTSGVSICTQQYIRNYFLDGTLPPPETVCEVNVKPFDTHGTSLGALSGVHSSQEAFVATLRPEKRELFEAIDALSKIPFEKGPFML